jgi:primosomal protein N' (replication factor Y)
LLQIAGRSGRSGEGRVLIQTQHRDFFERFLGDYEKFLKDEAGFRKELYPPFKRLMRVLVSDRDQLRGRDELLKVANCFERFNEVELVGAGEAGIAKIASKFRFNILLRSSSAKALLIAAKKCKTKSCEIDIDPITFS